MTSPIISVEHLSKRYIIGHQRAKGDGLRHAIEDTARAPWRWFRQRLSADFRPPASGVHPKAADVLPLASDLSRATREEFWALKDVSFEVKQGEVLGVIGRNGAGKSTLLKILSRITEPTEGRVRIKGRVASLLEVGTGFHPELTGRENIFLNGAILGMTKAEITRDFDEIVAFSEIEKFLDTPVKRYSSGMYVRLAFAVAAHLEPDILIVDEVLAVGDAAFQKKCLSKMGDVARGGRTVLFVSHNMQAVNTLCNTAILIERGVIADAGVSSIVVNNYLQRQTTAQSATSQRQWNGEGDAFEAGGIWLHSVRVSVSEGASCDFITTTQPFNIDIEYSNLLPGRPLLVTVILYSPDGAEVFESDTSRDPRWHGKVCATGRFKSSCSIFGNLLNEGQFRIRVIFHNVDTMQALLDCNDALVVSIHDNEERNYSWFGHFKGFVHPKLDWNTKALCGTAGLQSATSKSDLKQVP